VFSGSPAAKKENSVQRFTRYKKRKQCSAVHPLQKKKTVFSGSPAEIKIQKI
jgi:hypothetical protein